MTFDVTPHDFDDRPRLWTHPNPLTEYGPQMHMLLGGVVICLGLFLFRHVVAARARSGGF